MRIWAWPLKAAAVTLLVSAGACADSGAHAAPKDGKVASAGERSCFQARDVSSWAAVALAAASEGSNSRQHDMI